MTTLFDQFGRPIESGLTKRPETREIAVAQLRDRWSTYPSKGLTPAKLAEILAQADAGDVQRQAELFEEMEEKDAHLGSQFGLRKQAVTGLDFEIQPSPLDPKGEDVANFCRQCIEALPNWDENLQDMLDALSKGYSVHEIMWDQSEGQAMARGLNWIHPKKITFWNSLTPCVLTEAEPSRGEELQPFKWIYHRHKARSGYDTRAGIMRTCTWMYLFKNYTIKDWVSFSETYGQPLRIGKYGPNASEQDKEALFQAVRSIGVEAAGIISRNTEIEFIEAVRTGSLNVYEVLANFCDAQMSKAILGQTLTSEAGGSKGQGSMALGKVHNEVRLDLVRADAKALAKSINHLLLLPLVGFNFGWDRPLPQFKFVIEEPEDLEALSKVYTAFIDRGQKVSQEHIAARFGIPMAGEGETPLPGKAPAASAPTGTGDMPLKHLVLKAKPPAAPQADLTGAPVVAELTQRVSQAAGLAAWVHGLEALLAQCASLEEFRDRLVDAFAGMNPADVAEALQQALAVAELSGRFDASSGLGGEG
jgi:phage gp29-like protein